MLNLGVARSCGFSASRGLRTADRRDMRLSVSRLTAALVRRTSPGSATSASNTSLARRRARLAVFLTLPAFVLVLAAAWLAAESVVPEITDTDYHIRLRV